MAATLRIAAVFVLTLGLWLGAGWLLQPMLAPFGAAPVPPMLRLGLIALVLLCLALTAAISPVHTTPQHFVNLLTAATCGMALGRIATGLWPLSWLAFALTVLAGCALASGFWLWRRHRF